jgi:hypothetical protein
LAVESFLTADQEDFQNMVRDPQLFEDYVTYKMWQHEDVPGEVHYDGSGNVPGKARTHLGPNGVSAFIQKPPYSVSFSKNNRLDIEGEAPEVTVDRASENPEETLKEIAEELGLSKYQKDIYFVLDDETGVAYLTVDRHPSGDTIRVEGSGLPDKDSDNFQYSDELDNEMTRI